MTLAMMKISTAEKLDMLFRLLLIAPALFLTRLFRGFLFAIHRGVPLGSFATCAAIRVLLTVFSPRQIQCLLPSSIDTYRSWLVDKKKREQKAGRVMSGDKLGFDLESLPGTDAAIMWVGNRKTATRFILFLHGGGYVAPMTPGHLEWCWEAYIAAPPPLGPEVAIAVLQYTLIPASRQPTQLREAAIAVRHLLEMGVRPEDLILGGDSAGGNLAVQLMRHMIRPHPQVIPIPSEGRLAGVFLVSPLVGGSAAAWPSFKDNDSLDLLGTDLVSRLNTQLVSRHPSDPAAHAHCQVNQEFASPLDGDLGWINDWSSKSRATYITSGRQEVCRDSITSFAEEIVARNPSHPMVLEIPETELHGAILLEGQSKRPGDAIGRMRAWIHALS